MNNTIGYFRQRETFGAVDGPGVRYVLFLQGCPLHCLYCHNPETIPAHGGKAISVADAVKDILHYKNFIKDGGVTISGGEPMLQADFTVELLHACRTEGLHTAVDTSGFASESIQKRVAEAADLILLDIKSIDTEICKTITGHGNERALAMLEYCEKIQKPVWIRHVVVPGLTLEKSALTKLAEHVMQYSCVQCVELLPFHKMGEHKWKEGSYTLTDTPVPTSQEMAWVKRLFTNLGIKVH